MFIKFLITLSRIFSRDLEEDTVARLQITILLVCSSVIFFVLMSNSESEFRN
jgi:hypothetical protein